MPRFLIDANAFRFNVVVNRKAKIPCDRDFRVGRTNIDFEELFIDKGKKTIIAKGPDNPEPPPKPEKASEKKFDFVKIAGTFDRFRFTDLVKDKNGKKTGQPSGYGFNYPDFKDVDNRIKNFPWKPKQKKTFADSKKNDLLDASFRNGLKYFNLSFVAPFYCNCAKQKKCNVKLIELNFKYDGKSHPDIDLGTSDIGACKNPFALKITKKVKPSQADIIHKVFNSEYHFATFVYDLEIDCPCVVVKNKKGAKGKKEDEEGGVEANVAKKKTKCRAKIEVDYFFTETPSDKFK